jgi:hypothetical protein
MRFAQKLSYRRWRFLFSLRSSRFGISLTSQSAAPHAPRHLKVLWGCQHRHLVPDEVLEGEEWAGAFGMADSQCELPSEEEDLEIPIRK